MILLNSLFELLSIGILIPLVSIILDPELFTNFRNFFENQSLLSFLGIQNLEKDNFILYLLTITSVLYMLKFSINIFYSWFLNSAKIKNESLLGSKILENFSTTSNLYLFNMPISKLTYDVNSRVTTVASSIINISNLMVEMIIFTIIYLFLIYKFPGQSLILLFIIIPFFAYFYFVWRNKITKWSAERGEGGVKRNRNLLDYFNGIREIIIYSAHKLFIKEFLKNNKLYLNPQKKILLLSSLPRIILEFVFFGLILSVLFYYVLNGLDYDEIIVNFSVILVLMIRLLPSLNRLIFNFNQFKYCTESILKVHELIILSSENVSEDEFNDFSKSISLDNIYFNYLDKKNIFEELKLSIIKNSKVGIVGETGSGKSTLVDILIGLKKPTKGSILIDGKNVKNFKSWIKNISYVPQRIFLFNDSIRNNICFKKDNEEIDQEKFEKIIHICGLTEFIKKLPKKEFSKVGESGRDVSGGQRQKIGIARALYKNSNILIFDESTNALDELSEKNIVENILKLKDKTVILITHNLKNLENFDKTYVINDKKVNKH